MEGLHATSDAKEVDNGDLITLDGQIESDDGSTTVLTLVVVPEWLSLVYHVGQV